MESDTNRNRAILGWVATAVFAAISLVLLIMLMSADSGNLSDIREQIREDCAAADDQSRTECARSLAQLERILIEVRDDIETPGEPAAEADTVPAQ